MEYLVVSSIALLAAALSLFSGFGLGTLLLPAFALFFPVPVAVASTAIVHLANNVFKVGLVGGNANRDAVVRFALPAGVAAMLGAALLSWFAALPAVGSYSLGEQTRQVTWVDLVIGAIIIAVAMVELLPRFQTLAFDRKYLPLGGLLSGFLGGLSGNQGALRSAFLIKVGLSSQAFIGTTTVSAVIVDVARLVVYGLTFYTTQLVILGSDTRGLILAATLSAFVGSFLGARLIRKVTLRAIQVIVGVMLLLIGVGMVAGFV
ncbi:MAG: TSUP family transporter [Chloroflexi bacterium]|nr:TSUP family transporter [Chloroflexota bacterium]